RWSLSRTVRPSTILSVKSLASLCGCGRMRSRAFIAASTFGRWDAAVSRAVTVLFSSPVVGRAMMTAARPIIAMSVPTRTATRYRTIVAVSVAQPPECLEDLLVARADLEVHFDEFPTHDALPVDDEGGRMWPASPVRIKKSVAIDHPVLRIGQKYE